MAKKPYESMRYKVDRFLIDGDRFLIDGDRFLIDGDRFLIDGLSTSQMLVASATVY